MLVSKICLTGGPCAGKTTVISKIENILKEKGFKTFVVNEKATELMLEKFCNPFNYFKFNGEIVKREIEDEYFKELQARSSDEKYVIITDRGLMDNVGYAGEEIMNDIFKKYSLDFKKANENYDLVLHMETAAKDNPDEYNLESNETRYETIDEAIKRDDELLKAWKSHSNRKVIVCKNSNFEEKVNETVNEILNHIQNENLRTENKFKNMENAYKKLKGEGNI